MDHEDRIEETGDDYWDGKEVDEKTKEAIGGITPDPIEAVNLIDRIPDNTTQPKENAQPEKKNVPVPLVAKENGMLVGGTLEEQFRLAQYYQASQMLPAHYNTAPKILTAMQYCYELGLKPLSGMRQMAIIEGTPAIYGDLPLAIVRRSGQLEHIREFFIDAEGQEINRKNNNLSKEAVGAICIVKRKDAPSEVEAFFTLEDAKVAKLYPNPKQGAAWNKYPKLMMKYRARSQALKNEFGDILSGMPIAEYDYNTVIEKKKVIDLDHDGNERPADQGSAIMEAAGKSEPIEVKSQEIN